MYCIVMKISGHTNNTILRGIYSYYNNILSTSNENLNVKDCMSANDYSARN